MPGALVLMPDQYMIWSISVTFIIHNSGTGPHAFQAVPLSYYNDSDLRSHSIHRNTAAKSGMVITESTVVSATPREAVS